LPTVFTRLQAALDYMLQQRLQQWMLHWCSTAREPSLAPTHQLLVRCCTSGKYRFTSLWYMTWPGIEPNLPALYHSPGTSCVKTQTNFAALHVVCVDKTIFFYRIKSETASTDLLGTETRFHKNIPKAIKLTQIQSHKEIL